MDEERRKLRYILVWTEESIQSISFKSINYNAFGPGGDDFVLFLFDTGDTNSNCHQWIDILSIAISIVAFVVKIDAIYIDPPTHR